MLLLVLGRTDYRIVSCLHRQLFVGATSLNYLSRSIIDNVVVSYDN